MAVSVGEVNMTIVHAAQNGLVGFGINRTPAEHQGVGPAPLTIGSIGSAMRQAVAEHSITKDSPI